MTFQLESQHLKFHVAKTGGAVLNGMVLVNGQFTSFMPDTRHMEEKPKRTTHQPELLSSRSELHESMFIMAPYSNRIKNGKLCIENGEVRLRRHEEHSLHGDLWHRPTRVIQHSGKMIHLEFDMKACEINWPNKFEADVTYSVADPVDFPKNSPYLGSFRATLNLRNTSSEIAYLGGGFHPYFLKKIGTYPPVYFCPKVDKRLETVETGISETGNMTKDSLCEDLTSGLHIDHKAPYIDDCFSLAITQGQTPQLICKMNYGLLEIDMFVDSPLDHLVVYNPSKPYFAVEPVSHKNGDVHKTKIAPNKSLELSFELKFYRNQISL